MCGTLDPRFDMAQEFARSLENDGYRVETEWPRTAHGRTDDASRTEFEKYSQGAVQFFLRATEAAR